MLKLKIVYIVRSLQNGLLLEVEHWGDKIYDTYNSQEEALKDIESRIERGLYRGNDLVILPYVDYDWSE